MAAGPESAIAAGFENPGIDSQNTFRTVLDAMAAPASIQTIDLAISSPPPLNLATMAICLTLADYDTPLWIDPSLQTPAVHDSLAFHCGSPITERPEEAAFALVPGNNIGLERFAVGNEEFPEESTTLLVAVDGLAVDGDIHFLGPGIETRQKLEIAGLEPEFWAAWSANGRKYPLGVDVIFTSGARLACLPRTTQARRQNGSGE